MEQLIYQGSATEEKRIRATLELATDTIVKKVGGQGLEAIILAGGFGRGEGALLRDDGAPGAPFNDFDFLLVGRRPGVSAHILRELRRTLPRLLGVDFVDVGYMHSSQMSRVPPTVFFYELKNGNRVLWGSREVLSRIPSLDGSHLPLTEATRLFLNRGIGLLSVLLLLEEGEAGPLLGRRAAVAWSKVVLAAGDSLLLERGLYHWSYVERIRRVREVAMRCSPEARFAETYAKAASFKLTADFSVLPTQDSRTLCSEAGQIHETYFRRLEGKRTFADLSDWKTYPAVLLRVGLQPLRRRLKEFVTEPGGVAAHLSSLKRFVRLPLWGEERRLAILPLLLYAVLEPGRRSREGSYIAEACAIEYGRSGVQPDDWKRLASELVGESHP